MVACRLISSPFPCWWSILKCCLLFTVQLLLLWLAVIIPSLFLVGKLFCSSVGYQSGSGSAGGRDLPGADIIASWSVTLIRPYFSQRDHYQEPEETQECLQLLRAAESEGRNLQVLHRNWDRPSLFWRSLTLIKSIALRPFLDHETVQRQRYLYVDIWNENIQK